MSYLQRFAGGATPFGQTYDTSATGWSVSVRPNTATETWLTASGTNGYSFTGSGYIFGFMSANASKNTLGQLEVESSSSPRWQNGFFCGYPNTSRTASDDEAIGYGSTTEHYRGTYLTWDGYNKNSRINVIRIEP